MATRKVQAAEKFRLRLWASDRPRIENHKYVGLLVERSYGKRSSASRALPGLRRAHPDARMAEVQRFELRDGAFWIGDDRPDWIPLKTAADRLAERCMDVIDRAVAEGELPG